MAKISIKDTKSNKSTKKYKEKEDTILNENSFLRIGTEYFKRTKLPLASGDTLELIIKWSKSAIIDDLGTTSWKDFVKKIPRYDGFCCIPSHLDYQREIKGYYNKYEPFKYQGNIVEGNIDNTLKFVKHIFGEQYELGLDYLQLLLQHPTQKLPILCLVSRDRDTGKSTFVFWLKEIFGGNATVNTNQDFESNFNADWSSKLLIMVEETLLEKKEIGERLKYLSTTRYAKTEAKGKDKFESEFFGKFILCSNNEDSFIRIDREETRYWVRKVPTVERDPNFMDKLKAEIPAFLHFLNNRKLTTSQKTRLWFDEKLYETKELENLKMNSRDLVEKELEGVIISKFDELEDYDDVSEIHYTVGDLIKELKSSSTFKFTQDQVTTVLRKRWRLEPANNAKSYKLYSWTEGPGSAGSIIASAKKGRYYTFKIENFKEIQEGIKTEMADEDLPF